MPPGNTHFLVSPHLYGVVVPPHATLSLKYQKGKVQLSLRVFPKSVFNFEACELLVFRRLLKGFVLVHSALDSSYYNVVRKLQYKVRTVQRHGPFFLTCSFRTFYWVINVP